MNDSDHAFEGHRVAWRNEHIAGQRSGGQDGDSRPWVRPAELCRGGPLPGVRESPPAYFEEAAAQPVRPVLAQGSRWHRAPFGCPLISAGCSWPEGRTPEPRSHRLTRIHGQINGRPGLANHLSGVLRRPVLPGCLFQLRLFSAAAIMAGGLPERQLNSTGPLDLVP